jgi:hypothetical protein
MRKVEKRTQPPQTSFTVIAIQFFSLPGGEKLVIRLGGPFLKKTYGSY